MGCGISSNPSLCSDNLAYLNKLSPNGMTNVFCKEYGGNDPCSFVVGDPNFGLDKDPSKCNFSPGVLFLWDQPGADMVETGAHEGEFGSSQCGEKGNQDCAEWAAETWKKYVNKWRPELARARTMGMRVTSPRFQGEALLEQFAAFFAACPAC